jgi:hypothetical protein
LHRGRSGKKTYGKKMDGAALPHDAPGSQHVALVVPRLEHRLDGASDRFPIPVIADDGGGRKKVEGRREIGHDAFASPSEAMLNSSTIVPPGLSPLDHHCIATGSSIDNADSG